jgi:hypothetical protein
MAHSDGAKANHRLERSDYVTPNPVQRYADSAEVEHQCMTREGKREVDDHVALAIAAMWQSPGTIGHVLASLASGHTVKVSDLLDDIHHTRREATDNGTLTSADDLQLGMLATWALTHPSRWSRAK